MLTQTNDYFTKVLKMKATAFRFAWHSMLCRSLNTDDVVSLCEKYDKTKNVAM